MNRTWHLLLALSLVFLTACSLFKRSEDETPSADAATHTAGLEAQAAATPVPVNKPTLDTPSTIENDPTHLIVAPKHEVHWGYDAETGPEKWGDLAKEFELCKTGQNQSPVDLIFKKPKTGHGIKTHYKASPVKIIDNGHTVQVNFQPGNTIELDGQTFDLLQFHFHTASEHTLSGNKLPMELHLVHRSGKGDYAVLGVILIEGPSHSIVETLWQNMPIQKGMEKELSFMLNPDDLIPTTRTHYNYMGSFTAPPCSEGVNWNVFNTPMTLSKEQILTFRQLYPDNSRPVQPLNDRKTVNYK